jgi:cell wall assembly regulator SMI1
MMAGGGASMSLPERGPWVVTATASSVDWAIAAAALAATSGGRSAAVVIAAREPALDMDLLRALVASYVTILGEPPRLDDVAAVVRALAGSHVRVLVVAADGLITPLGADGWTAADLAVELHAPVAVVAGTDADAVGHTMLMLEALESRRIPASVLAVGDGGDFGVLPVRLAGRIPADAQQHRDRFAEAAREWVDPLTGAARAAERGEPAGAESDERPVETAPVQADLQTRIAKKAAWGLLVAFCLALVMLFLCNGRVVGTFAVAELRAKPAASPYTGRPTRWPTGQNPAPQPRRSAAAVCPTNSPGASVAAADPTASARVDAAWARIERWLAARAPTSYKTLRPPATPERIAAAQARMSVAFPPDLVASLRRHDGVDQAGAFTLPPFFQPLTLDQIVSGWSINCSVAANIPAGSDWWHRAFVPFATDHGGGVLIVDQRPGSHGRVGRFDPEMGGAGFERWPASVAELLERVVTSLETGAPYDGRYRPVVTAAGELDWEILHPSPR